jgi:hypothetical protein
MVYKSERIISKASGRPGVCCKVIETRAFMYSRCQIDSATKLLCSNLLANEIRREQDVCVVDSTIKRISFSIFLFQNLVFKLI